MENAINTKNTTLNGSRKWLVIIFLCVSTVAPSYAAVAKSTILPTALSGMANGMVFYALVLVSSSVGMALFLPVAGKICDMVGKKKILLITNILYIVSCVIVAVSTNVALMFIGIFATGVTFAFVNCSVKAIFPEICTEQELPRILGLATMLDGVSQILAPALGGLFADTIGWRWVYLICIPFIGIASLILLFALPKHDSYATGDTKIDVPGLIAFFICFLPMLILLSVLGSMITVGSPLFWFMLALVVLGFVLLIIFERRTDDPIIPFKLFRSASFTRLFLVGLLGCATYASMYYYPVFLQNVVGVTATASGYLQIPRGIIGVVVAGVVGVWIGKRENYKMILIIEMCAFVVSFVMFLFFGHDTSRASFIIASLFYGLGHGGIQVCIMAFAQRSVGPDEYGSATSMMLFSTTFGVAIGNALSGPIVNISWRNAANVIPDSLRQALTVEQYSGLLDQSILTSGEAVEQMREGLSGSLQPVLDDTIVSLKEQLMNGIRWLNLMCLLFTVLALVLSLTLKMKKPGDVKASAEAEAAEAAEAK